MASPPSATARSGTSTTAALGEWCEASAPTARDGLAVAANVTSRAGSCILGRDPAGAEPLRGVGRAVDNRALDAKAPVEHDVVGRVEEGAAVVDDVLGGRRADEPESVGARHRPLLVLPNSHDVASARVIEVAAPRIATTSAGISWARGRPDGGGLTSFATIRMISPSPTP